MRGKARIVAAGCLTLGLAAGGWLLTWGPARPTPDKALSIKKEIIGEPPKPAKLISRVLFTGDIYWGRSTHQNAQRSALKEAYPFARLNEFDRESYDAWVGNMECPSVPGVNQPFSLEKNQLVFNCPSTYLPEFAKWFTAVSLANNHTANQHGQPGIEATRQALDAAGIQYFGHYDPMKLADVCEVVSLPARLRGDEPDKEALLPLALCGYHGLSVAPSAASLAVMKAYSQVMPVIAYPHMGVEYTAKPTAQQTSLYRRMIDNGADAVLAAHPHWVQPAEVYKDKLIVYSMGNFMFDQLPGETQRGAAIDLTLTADLTKTATKDIDGWITVAKDCEAFQDDCLTQIQSRQLPRLEWLFTYEAVGVDMSQKQTHLATDKTKDLILRRLNWATVSPQLHP